MKKFYKYIENPNIYAIYKRSSRSLFVSTNPEAD